MISTPSPKQSDSSVGKNATFFRDNLEEYSSHIEALDTYRNIREFTNEALLGIDRLLDIGNGGTFDYDVGLVRELVALDLFLEELPDGAFPSNVRPRNGSALAVPEPAESFDGVILSMLIHHLVGKNIEESIANVRVAIAEAFRVLKPGGKLIIIESCIPAWFYTFEKALFPLASKVIEHLLDHPLTLQYPPAMILNILKKHATEVECNAIPVGKWVLQYGFKFPTALTPVTPYRFVVQKRP